VKLFSFRDAGILFGLGQTGCGDPAQPMHSPLLRTSSPSLFVGFFKEVSAASSSHEPIAGICVALDGGFAGGEAKLVQIDSLVGRAHSLYQRLIFGFGVRCGRACHVKSKQHTKATLHKDFHGLWTSPVKERSAALYLHLSRKKPALQAPNLIFIDVALTTVIGGGS
jgi:hypothetical protein